MDFRNKLENTVLCLAEAQNPARQRKISRSVLLLHLLTGTATSLLGLWLWLNKVHHFIYMIKNEL